MQKNSGTTVLDQDRDHNHVNEIDVDDDHSNAAGASITASTGTNWFDPTYDAAGNMTTVPKPASLANGLSCKYDAWNRLVEVKDGEDVIAAAEYDGLHRRTIELPSYGTTTYYMHKYWNASWQMVEQRQNTNDAAPESSGVARQCVWSARYVDAAVLENIWGTRRYLLGDANFNVTSVINTSRQPVEHYQYDPYGRATVLNGGTPDTDGDEWTADPNNSTDVSNLWRYTGRWLDYRSLFYHYRHRHYHHDLGRFMSRDPIAYLAGDSNLYGYCANSPVSQIDPDGRQGIAGKYLRLYVRLIEEELQAGNDEAAAKLAWEMYNNIVVFGAGREPLAALFMRNWLRGAPDDPYIINSDVQGAISDKSGPYQRLQAYLTAWAATQRTTSGDFSTSMLPQGGVVRGSWIYVYASEGEYYHALGGFNVSFHGRWKCAGTKLEFTGMWRIRDRYYWKRGFTANVAGATIPDDYGLLVERHYKAKPFNVVGAWHGTMVFDSARPVPPPAGTRSGGGTGGDGR